MNSSLKTRLLSLLLSFAMVCSFVSVPALATNADLEITDVEAVETADDSDEVTVETTDDSEEIAVEATEDGDEVAVEATEDSDESAVET
ncbi:MAG: hypothetical protein LUG64_00490, partial [Clostridiales bacterium]|nr:hypothetical protein [Clostridiales bacterium]